MTKQVQRRRGTATQHTSFTGAEGETSVNTTNKSVHVHDGSTAGGIEAARADLVNVSDANLNAALTGNTVAALTITTADINGGTIDGTVIGGATAAAVTGTAITGTSFTTTGDMSFGDDDKAIFGAGSDLQIYHDGSHSVIKEAGTGNLQFYADTRYQFFNADGSASYAQFIGDGGAGTEYVQLRYGNSPVLATTATGIDVTGTITSDGLTVDGNVSVDGGTIKLDGNYPVGSNNVALGDAALGSNVSGASNVAIGGDALTANTASGNIAVGFQAAYSNTTGTQNTFTGTYSGYSNTTANNNTGYGYDSLLLNVTGAFNTATGHGTLRSSTASYNTAFGYQAGRLITTGSKNTIIGGYNGNQDGLDIRTSSNNIVLSDGDGNPRVLVDSSGNVGIGTSSLNARADVSSTSTSQTTLRVKNSGSNPSQVLVGFDGTSANYFDGNTQVFRNGAGSTTTMTIDSSGNLLVGKTSSDISLNGFVTYQNGNTTITRTSGTANVNYVLLLNRLNTDGDILDLRKDGNTVGSIGVDSGDNFYVGATAAGHSGLYFGNSGALPMSAGARSDNSEDLGSDDYRFKDLYLSGGAYLGGTAAANKLDDYEEGTWTPTANAYSGTMTVYEAYYVKVGAMVFIYMDLAFSGDDSSTVTINGLPFAPSYNQGRGGLSTTFNSTDIDGMWNLGSTNINFKPRTGNGNINYTQVNTNGKRLGGSGWYIST
jgi:hypothetical protein